MTSSHTPLDVAAELALAHIAIGTGTPLARRQLRRTRNRALQRPARRVAAYDAWCAHDLATRRAAGDARPDVQHFRDVPAPPIAAFKQLPIYAPDAPVAAFRSSGTTAPATLHPSHAVARALRCVARCRGRSGARARRCQRRAEPLACVQLQPAAGDRATGSSLTHMYDRIRQGPWCDDHGAWVDGDYRMLPTGRRANSRRARPRVTRCCCSPPASRSRCCSTRSARRRSARACNSPRQPGGRHWRLQGRTREISREELLARVGAWLDVEPEWCENEYGMSELSSPGVARHDRRCDGLPARRGRRARYRRRRGHFGRALDAAVAAGARRRPDDPHEVVDGERGCSSSTSRMCVDLRRFAAKTSASAGGRASELVGRAPGGLKGCSLQLREHHVTTDPEPTQPAPRRARPRAARLARPRQLRARDQRHRVAHGLCGGGRRTPTAACHSALSAAAMRQVLEAELGADADLADAPEHVLVLASGNVPGLAIEGMAAAIALGATALVRPSRDDTVLDHFVSGSLGADARRADRDRRRRRRRAVAASRRGSGVWQRRNDRIRAGPAPARGRAPCRWIRVASGHRRGASRRGCRSVVGAEARRRRLHLPPTWLHEPGLVVRRGERRRDHRSSPPWAASSPSPDNAT